MSNYQNANDDMRTLITKANKNQTVIGYVPEIRFQNVEKDTKPASDKFWLRVEINTLIAEQKALAQCVQKNGQRLYTAAGLVKAELYIPKANGKYEKGELWAMAIRNAFLGVTTEHGVWFRNSAIRELPIEAEFYRINVVSEFEYSEIY